MTLKTKYPTDVPVYCWRCAEVHAWSFEKTGLLTKVCDCNDPHGYICPPCKREWIMSGEPWQCGGCGKAHEPVLLNPWVTLFVLTLNAALLCIAPVLGMILYQHEMRDATDYFYVGAYAALLVATLATLAGETRLILAAAGGKRVFRPFFGGDESVPKGLETPLL